MPQTQPTTGIFEDDRAGTIYRTAAKMIKARGFASTSMNDIAEAVSLTKPGLYYYVKGKKELLFSIMRFAMNLLDSEVVAQAEPETDPEKRLRIIVAQHARLLMLDQNGAMGILIDEVDGLAPDQKDEIIHRKRRYFDFVRGTISAVHEARGLTQIDSTITTFSVLGMVMWLSRWYDDQGALESERVANDLTSIAVAAVLADPRATASPASFPRVI